MAKRQQDPPPFPLATMGVFNLRDKTLVSLIYDESWRDIDQRGQLRVTPVRLYPGSDSFNGPSVTLFPLRFNLVRWYEEVSKKGWVYTEAGPWVPRIENAGIVGTSLSSGEREPIWYPASDPRLSPSRPQPWPPWEIAAIQRMISGIAQFASHRKYGISFIEQIVAALPDPV